METPYWGLGMTKDQFNAKMSEIRVYATDLMIELLLRNDPKDLDLCDEDMLGYLYLPYFDEEGKFVSAESQIKKEWMDGDT